jgi:CHAD domain-containing protein
MAHKPANSVIPGQTVEEAFEYILKANLALVKDWEPVALAGKDTEGVHQMRVGLRRMRSALSVFRPAIPLKLTRPLAKEMRWAAKALDRARDLDVYLAENFAGKRSKSLQKMQSIAREHRDLAYSRVRGIVQCKRYLTFNREIITWLDTRSWRGQLSEEERKILRRKITPFTCQVLEEHHADVLKAGKELDKMDSEALHQLRIKCKKLRYATEFFYPLYGERMEEFTRHLKALQDLLGTLHDTAILSGLQKNLLKDTRSSKLMRVAGKLADKREKESEEIKNNLMTRWQAFSETGQPWDKSKTGKRRPRNIAGGVSNLNFRYTYPAHQVKKPARGRLHKHRRPS